MKTEARRYYHSSSFLMAMLFTLLLGSAAVLIAYSGYYFGNEYFTRSAEKLIDTEIYHLVQADKDQRLPEVMDTVKDRPDRLVGLIEADGRILDGNLKVLPREIESFPQGMVIFSNESGQTYGAKIVSLPNKTRIFVAIEISEMLEVGTTVKILGIITIFLMSIVILTSFLISTFVVSRTNRIAMTAKEIMDTGDLSRRIEIDGRWDDLSNMATVLNAFLARIEDLLVGIKRVSDNIAHDLRTPLTRIRNRLETLKQNSDELDPNHAGYDAIIGEADRLLSVFNALLRIARIETSKQKTQFKTFNLSHLLHGAVELYGPLAEEKLITLSTDIPEMCDYCGDSDLLFQAMANLLDNSIKFTPEGGEVKLYLTTEVERPVISVSDSGPGIKDDDQAKVFDRFYRAEESRTTPGNGLGLSLVAAVIMLHEGKIALKNLHPGLEIRISL